MTDKNDLIRGPSADRNEADADTPFRSGSVDDLPERILAADSAVDELEKITPSDFDGLAGQLRAAEGPLRHGAITADPVAAVAVVDVRNAVEPRLDPCPHLLAAHQPPASRRWPARHVENTILGKEGHDCVDIVGVERWP